MGDEVYKSQKVEIQLGERSVEARMGVVSYVRPDRSRAKEQQTAVHRG